MFPYKCQGLNAWTHHISPIVFPQFNSLPHTTISDNDSFNGETDAPMMILAMYEQHQLRIAVKKKAERLSHGGTTSWRRTIPRDRISAHENLMQNYFADPPLYPLSEFHNRFHMRRELLNRIMEQIFHFDDYFMQQLDATWKLGFSPQVEMTATLCMLANLNDNYLKIA